MSVLNIHPICNAADDRIERNRGSKTIWTYMGEQEKEGKQSDMRMR